MNLVQRKMFNPNGVSAWFSSIVAIMNQVSLLTIVLTGAAVIRERDVLLVFEKEEDVNDLIRALPSLNAKLISLSPRKETLEEYFIREVSKPDTSPRMKKVA